MSQVVTGAILTSLALIEAEMDRERAPITAAHFHL
jgi:hypothetical protein